MLSVSEKYIQLPSDKKGSLRYYRDQLLQKLKVELMFLITPTVLKFTDFLCSKLMYIHQ